MLFLLILVNTFWPEDWYESYRVIEQVEAYETAVALPDSVSGREPALALSMHLTGEIGALEVARSALSADSSDFRNWTALGAILTETDAEQAEAAFERALSLAPGTDPVLLESMAYLHLAGSDPDEAYRLASDALLADPGFTPASLTAAWALEDLGRQDEAIMMLSLGIELNPSAYSLMEEKATLFQSLGMPDSAQTVLEDLLERSPSRPSALRLLGTLHEEQGRLGHAVKTFRRILADRPEDHWTWGQLGLLMERLGRMDTAREYYQEGIAVNPSYAWAYYRLASIAQDPSESISYLEDAVEADSTFEAAWTDLGLAYEDSGDLQKAVDAFRKSLDVRTIKLDMGRTGLVAGIPWED